jgi:glutamate 5-kinase
MQQTIVVKIGSSSLTTQEGGLDRAQISFFAKELATLAASGQRVMLVTSGAVAAGYMQIGYAQRPKLLHEKQASAAVGQALLMQAYNDALSQHGYASAQILLTRYDFSNLQRVQNARHTIDELLARKIIPIVNENDVVSVGELKFGDNDTLSALVANLVKANQLVIITDTDGLYTDDPRKNPEARQIARVEQIDDTILQLAGGTGSQVGTGGMRSKIIAASMATRGGVPVFVGKVDTSGDLQAAVAGTGKGTYFETAHANLSTKKQWIGFHSIPQGAVTVDDGAAHALLRGGKSLLPVGVVETSGEFEPGDAIDVLNKEQQLLGRGISNYATWQIRAVMGLSSEEVAKRIDVERLELIHRDEWMTLKEDSHDEPK